MMTEDTFFRIMDTTIISIILFIIFMIAYAIFRIKPLLWLGLASFGIYAVVWGGALIWDMISDALNPKSSTNMIGVISYIALAVIISVTFYLHLK